MPTPPPKVFVSSTWLDLQHERDAVEAAIRRMRTPGFVGMEYFGSRDETPREVSIAEVDRSDVYVGIFAARYGSGITEEEYRRARKHGLTCKIYFKATASTTLDKFENDPAQQSRLEALKAELRRSHTCTEFTTPDDLAKQVVADLHSWIVEEYLPRFTSPEEAPPKLSALHQLPAPPRDFTGRTEEIEELTRAIERGGVNISGIQGQGGIGKTTLAFKLAELLVPRYPDAQFYIDLKGTTQPLSPADAMAHVIRAYHPAEKLPDNEAELSALYRSVLHGKRALLLMDNASDAEQVAPLTPPDTCALLVTSRTHFALPGLFAKDLDTLPPEDARTLLLTIAPRIGKHADEIARLCGYLPLALRLAASIIVERKNLKPENYARRLTDATQRLELVEASLKLSYDLLSAKLQRLWRALGVFPATFDAQAAAAVWQIKQEAADDALGELVKYSLLNWDDAIDRYSLHDLARLSARQYLGEEESHAAGLRHAEHYFAVLSYANDLYKHGGEDVIRGLTLFDAERTNIQAGQAWAALHTDEEPASRLCAAYPSVGIYVLELRHHPRVRISWLEKALSIAEKMNSRFAMANALGNLGNAYSDLSETRRAVEFYEQALNIGREIGDRRGEGNALGSLGNAYSYLGETHRAVEFYEQALEVMRELGDRRREGAALTNIGLAYRRLGETQRAVEFYEQALEVMRAAGDHYGEAATLSNLGNAYRALGETHRAIKFYKQALEIDRKIGNRRGEGRGLGGLGSVYATLGETDRAIEFYEHQLVISKEIEDREGESAALFNMSLMIAELGKRARAIELAEMALAICEQIEDPNAPKVRKQLDEWWGQAK